MIFQTNIVFTQRCSARKIFSRSAKNFLAFLERKISSTFYKLVHFNSISRRQIEIEADKKVFTVFFSVQFILNFSLQREFIRSHLFLNFFLANRNANSAVPIKIHSYIWRGLTVILKGVLIKRGVQNY